MADPLEHIRNVGIIAHIDAGKTTTTERLLFYAGLEHRLGNVDNGTTVTDWMDEERKRGITITAADVTIPWRDHHINLVDTPGHVDFTAEVERSLRVLDGAVVIFDAVAGVQAQSETVWRQADRYRIPRIAYINKMDRVGADFDKAVESIRARLGARALPIQMPLGSGPHFRAVIDLVTMTARVHDEASLGARYTDGPVPPEARELAELRRDELLHALADFSDPLMEKYLDDQPIGPDDIIPALRAATLAVAGCPSPTASRRTDPGARAAAVAQGVSGQPPVGDRRFLVPVLCGSSLRNVGVQALADAIVRYLPSPLDVPPVGGTHPKTGDRIERKPSPKAHPCALVFKIASDPHGDLFYLRVYSGSFASGRHFLNPRTGQRERLTHLFRMYANERQALRHAGPGDIVAVIGPKGCATGDTLCDPKHPVVLGAMAFPEAVISMAIEPKTSGERERLNDVLARLEREDPTFRRHVDPETGQTIISGMGELHLEVLKHRMLTDFHVDANVGAPRVSYKETLAGPADGEGRYVHQSGGRGQYGHVRLHLEPVRGSTTVEVGFEVSLEDIPRQFRPAVEDGIRGGAAGGVAAGYPVVGVKVTVSGGSTHSVDSTEMAYEAAATRAFRDGAERAGIVLLEPWMRFEVMTPEAHLGDVLSDLYARRADIDERSLRSGVHVLVGKVPLSAMFGYATALRSLSQGRATYTMEPLEYRPVPDDIADKFLL